MKSKTLFTIMFLFLGLSFSAQSQEWRKINQKYFGVKYMLPESWEVDGFGGDDWESYGSSVCQCAGTINIGNRFEEDDIFMVIYPTRENDSIDGWKRTHVWDMKFVNTGETEVVKTKHARFKKMVSKWKKETAGDRADDVVWRFTTSYKRQHYVIYFWAKPETISENKELIEKILHSIKPVKRRQ